MAHHGFGIIGCGMIAEFHVKAINEVAGARVVAAFSRSRANAEKIGRLAGSSVTLYDDLGAMLQHPELDVVCICTPSGAHLEPCLKAAEAGKHILVEKPLEVTTTRCDQMIEACRDAHVQLGAIFPSRLSQANLMLKAAIDEGRFGRLTIGDTYVKWWRSQEYYDSGGWRGTWDLDGGGALMNQAIHNVDLIQWLMGDVETVTALTSTLAHDRIEVEDTAVAAVRFRNGALGTIQAATSAYPGLLKRTEIHGASGSARVEQDSITYWNFAEISSTDSAIEEQIRKSQSGVVGGASDPRGISHTGHRDQIKAFLQAIDAGKTPEIDGHEGRKAVEIIRAIYHSAQIRAAVDLPFSDPK